MPIRNLVRLLRDNGWNTTSSSGNDMSIGIDLKNMDDIENIAQLLVRNGYKTFELTGYLINDGGMYWKRIADVRVSGGGRI